MSKRFKKDYSIDGWPILDNEFKAILSTDDIVKTLNDFNSDQRLSDDPLTALAAVMRHHDIRISCDTINISIESNDYGSALEFESEITADDIRPEENTNGMD